MERGQREREGGGRLGLPSWPVCKERERKREKKSFAKIHLKFEKFKIWSKWWW
jgi:hypothetical protein